LECSFINEGTNPLPAGSAFDPYRVKDEVHSGLLECHEFVYQG